MINGLLGVITAAASITCLYLSWQNRFPRHTWLMPTGWLAALVSTLFLISANGAEFGIAYACLFIPLFAWFAVLLNLEIKRKHQRINESVAIVVPATRTVLRHIALFFITVPLSGIATAYVSVAFVMLLPLSVVNAVVLVVLIAPISWGVAAWWACADPKRFRPIIWISTAGLLGAALVYS